jgi:hypothetical protein
MTKPRQAVVLIHGIGEQRPMETLRTFVVGVLGPNQTIGGRKTFYSKPDPNAEGFELRRFRAFKGRADTDFIEFYWQHQMPIAAWRFLYSWLWLLMNRPAKAMPRRFAVLWWIAWIVVVLLAVVFLLALAQWLGAPIANQVAVPKAPWIVAAAATGLGGILRAFVGDAAIYLNPHPRTVEARNTIRASGVALLERLHKDGRYDRIIVVGHSLGSVIGYDILNFAWQRASEQFRQLVEAGKLPQDQPSQLSLSDSEALAADPKTKSEAWTASVRRVARETRDLGLQWMVSDFITLGSPLAHANLLLARGPDDLKQRFGERELPTSPPFEENGKQFSYERSGVSPPNSKRDARVPDHAAVFGLTAWHNLYFPCRHFLYGDLVGGAVGSAFGRGVNDEAVVTGIRNGWLSHTEYWTRYEGFENQPPSAPLRLIKALDLDRKSFPRKSPMKGASHKTRKAPKLI